MVSSRGEMPPGLQGSWNGYYPTGRPTSHKWKQNRKKYAGNIIINKTVCFLIQKPRPWLLSLTGKVTGCLPVSENTICWEKIWTCRTWSLKSIGLHFSISGDSRVNSRKSFISMKKPTVLTRPLWKCWAPLLPAMNSKLRSWSTSSMPMQKMTKSYWITVTVSPCCVNKKRGKNAWVYPIISVPRLTELPPSGYSPWKSPTNRAVVTATTSAICCVKAYVPG